MGFHWLAIGGPKVQCGNHQSNRSFISWICRSTGEHQTSKDKDWPFKIYFYFHYYLCSRPSSIKYNCFYSRFWSMPSIFCYKCNYWFIDSVHPYQGWNARLNWYCWPIKAIISLRGLGNESLIEETDFVSQVNELEIDSSEKLERWMSYQLQKLFTLMLHHFLLIFVPSVRKPIASFSNLADIAFR